MSFDYRCTYWVVDKEGAEIIQFLFVIIHVTDAHSAYSNKTQNDDPNTEIIKLLIYSNMIAGRCFSEK